MKSISEIKHVESHYQIQHSPGFPILFLDFFGGVGGTCLTLNVTGGLQIDRERVKFRVCDDYVINPFDPRSNCEARVKWLIGYIWYSPLTENGT